MTIKNLGIYNYDNEYIGKGSFSKVYKGYNRNNIEEKYAIKKIYKKSEEKYIKLVEREIEIMTKLNHKNIVKLYDKIYTEKHIFLIMELCDSDLNKYINENEIEENDIKYIMRQIIDVLKYIMDNNIVHRDLKPHNILINNNKEIKLADFGFAREFKDTLISETICGSPLYMAPEILNNDKYNIKSDLWSLGVILYQMIMKQHPYYAQNIVNLRILINKNEKIKLNININSDCKKLIEELLQKDYNQRIEWDDLYNNKWIYNINSEKPNSSLKTQIKHLVKNEDNFDYCIDNSIVMDYEMLLEYKKEKDKSLNNIKKNQNDFNLKNLIIDNYLCS